MKMRQVEETAENTYITADIQQLLTEDSKLSFQEQQRLIEDNLALVKYCIKRYIYIGTDEYEDLFQEGCIGLILAARRFDPDLGYAFSTFAISNITGLIKRYKRNKSNKYRGINVGRSLIDKMSNLYKELSEENMEYANDYILEKVGITREEYDKMIINIQSIDDKITINNGEDLNIQDLIPSVEKGFDEVEADLLCEQILDKAKDKLQQYDYDILEEMIYECMYGEGELRQMELAMRYSTSQTSVSRKIKKIRQVVKEILESINKE